MEGEEAHHQPENSFTANVFPDLELKSLPTTHVGRLAERIDKNHLIEETVKEDGNSIFSSLNKVLKKSENLHLKMREVVVEEMIRNKEIYMELAEILDPLVASPDSFDAYLEKMSKEGTHGDLMCVLAVANMFHVRVIILTSRAREMAYEITPTDSKSKKDVFLSYREVNEPSGHFNALFHPNDKMEGEEAHHQWENESFTADPFPNSVLKDLPVTIAGILSDRLDRSDLVLKTAEGDGNCLFRSVTKVLKNKQKLHLEMRTELVNEMRGKKALYRREAIELSPQIATEAAFDAYLEDISKEGAWGDLICVLAAANVFHVRFTVITSVYPLMAMEISPTDNKSKKDVFLTHLFSNESSAHCDAVFPRNEVPAVDRRSPSPSDKRARVRWYKLRVGNIPETMTTDVLTQKVSDYGKVCHATFAREEGTTGRIGIVTMNDRESLDNAIAAMKGKVWDGMKITVEEEKEGLLCPYDYKFDEW